jgi:hypothetical protein
VAALEGNIFWEEALGLLLDNVNNDNNYAFAMQHKAFSKTMYKWIMNWGVTKYMTSQRMVYATCKVVAPRNIN